MQPNSFETLFATLKTAGLPGVIIGVAICGFVYFGTFTGFLPNGTWRRLAVALGGYFFSGLNAGEVYNAFVAAISVLVAGLLKLAIDAGTAGMQAILTERKLKAAAAAAKASVAANKAPASS